MALNVFVVRGQQNCQSAITARLSDARYNTSVAVYSQELVKQRQLILIDRMQSQLNEQATDNVNLQSQLLNQTAVDANLKTQLTNLLSEQDKKNAIIANLQSQLANLTAIITNLTAEQDKKNADNFFGSNQLLFDVRRSPTPFLPDSTSYDTWMKVPTLPYDKTITNIANCINMYAGIFTAPTTGSYLLTWTGPNGELIPKPAENVMRLFVNNAINEQGWQNSLVESRMYTNLNKGDIVFLKAFFHPKHYFSRQPEKWVGVLVQQN